MIMLHTQYTADISNLQRYTCRLGWKFKHLIGYEDCLTFSINVQVLSQGGFLILLYIVIPHQAGHRFHVDEDEVKLENVDRSIYG
jgi:hypothetical protein